MYAKSIHILNQLFQPYFINKPDLNIPSVKIQLKHKSC